MVKTIKIVLKIAAAILCVVLVAALCYIGYVYFSYRRIADFTALGVQGEADFAAVQTQTEYTIVTQNVGFGAYTPEFTFFMDGGTQSRAESKQSADACVKKAAETVAGLAPDFALFQEVDTDADRSFHTDQRKIIDAEFEGFCSVFAENYHSAYLFYPVTRPIGASKSGIYTFSAFGVTSAVRRSLPVSDGLGRFLDLDRCYSVSRVPVRGGGELVLYNVHTSAYGAGEEVRALQMRMLLEDMASEYEKGNYCVCGGDFNHDFTGDSTVVFNGSGASYGWAQPFPEDILAEYGVISRAADYDGELVPTCRNCDVPYDENTFTLITDGFLVSRNVEVTYVRNVDTGFEYSDHNPVEMRFVLKAE